MLRYFGWKPSRLLKKATALTAVTHSPTSAVGGSFILNLQNRPPHAAPNPINAVGGISRDHLCVIDFFSSLLGAGVAVDTASID